MSTKSRRTPSTASQHHSITDDPVHVLVLVPGMQAAGDSDPDPAPSRSVSGGKPGVFVWTGYGCRLVCWILDTGY